MRGAWGIIFRTESDTVKVADGCAYAAALFAPCCLLLFFVVLVLFVSHGQGARVRAYILTRRKSIEKELYYVLFDIKR